MDFQLTSNKSIHTHTQTYTSRIYQNEGAKEGKRRREEERERDFSFEAGSLA